MRRGKIALNLENPSNVLFAVGGILVETCCVQSWFSVGMLVLLIVRPVNR